MRRPSPAQSPAQSPALSPRVRPWAALLLALPACADPADPCAPMCAAAASAYGACLDPDGEGAEAPEWEAAGYADRQDFLDACDTWSWEQRLIADEEGAPERVDAACAQREDALRTAADPCAAFSGMEWSAPLR